MYRYPINWITVIGNGYHKGKSLDFGYDGHSKQNVYSIGAGVVLKTEVQSTGGKTIFIKHTNGNVSCYGHLNNFSVRKGEKVKLGQKIGNMGKTGICTGEHLHFGIYENDKNIYGNATIDTFKVCYVYPDQNVNQLGDNRKFLSKYKYYDDRKIWKKGKYKLLYDKYDRKTHNISTNIYRVKELTKWTAKEKKDMLTSIKPNSYAQFKAGAILDIVDIYDENGRIWGKYGAYGSDWVVLCNIDGTIQAQIIKD